MGFDNECIINIQSLAGEYFCPVCRLLVYPNEALQTQCTHLYCKTCLTYVARTSQACPYDGYLVTESDSKPLVESNKALADMIGKVSVHCLFHRSGCTWQGLLSECISHCSGCAFGNSPVVCNRCGVQIVHRQVQEHAQSCSGVQIQSQQSSAAQSSAATGVCATLKQNPAGSQAVPSASLPQTSYASSAPLAPTSRGFSQQQATLASQAQSAQGVLPTPDQWYQQQQQYQQYYQQYPGYDPYQQQYQQYYPYQQQPAQQYPHQPGQAYPSQVPAQPPSQPQQLQQAPSPAQAQLLPQAPTAASTQQQAYPTGQPQSQPTQVQGQSQVASQSQQHPPPQPYPQAQNYTQPIVAHPGPQQPSQMPQYQQTHIHLQPSHPQTQARPYNQPLVHSYPHPQTQPQAQPHPPHPSTQTPPNPPLINQPVNMTAQNPSAHAVAGYQQYPQSQPSQHPQPGGPYSMPITGSYHPSQHPGQVQGHFPLLPTQMRPPQSHAVMPPQQQSTVLPSQAQYPGAPVAQAPIYPQPQQPSYPAQQRPGVRPAQEALAQQPSFSGQGPFMQQHPPMQASLRPEGPGQMYQHYPERPMFPQGMGQHPYLQAAVVANVGHIRPAHLGTKQPSVSQTYPLQSNIQSSPAVHGQQSLKPSGVEKPRDQNLEKANLEQDKGGTHSVEMERRKSENDVDGLDDKKSLSESSNKEHPLQEQKSGADSELLMGENGSAPEGHPKINKEVGEGAVEHSPASKSVEIVPKEETVQGLDKGSGASSHSVSTPFASKVSGYKLLPVPYGPSHQQRYVGPSMPQSIPHSTAPQDPVFLGQPPSQLRPPVPGQILPAPPFGMVDSTQASILKQPPGSFHPDNPSAGVLGPGSVTSFGRGPGNLALPSGSLDQGNAPHLSRNHRGELLSGPPFDSRGGITGRAPSHGSEGSFNGRQPDLHLPGPMEPGSFGQPSKTRFRSPPGHDPLPAHGLQDEGLKMLQDWQFRSFPGETQLAGDRQVFGDSKEFPRPPLIDSGPMGKSGIPPSVLDQGPFIDGNPRPFDKAPPGVGPVSSRFMPPSHASAPFHPNDAGPVPRFGQRVMARSPGRDYGGDPSHGFEGFSGAAPSHLRRGEFDGPGNLCARFGDVIGPDMMPEHFRPSNMRPGEAPDFGAFGGHLQMGDPPLPGSFLPHQSFGETFGRDRVGYSHIGEPGFRNSYSLQRYARDGGFYPGEVDRFDIPRNRKVGSIMCRICKVDCETVEGLDLHSQTREHQKRAMDMVISIKRQNAKKQKIANDRSSLQEGGKPRNFEGRRNKR